MFCLWFLLSASKTEHRNLKKTLFNALYYIFTKNTDKSAKKKIFSVFFGGPIKDFTLLSLSLSIFSISYIPQYIFFNYLCPINN